ncbi:helix-turn-helix domain-containing protein [Pseudomonas mosselii]|uniref:helix-turn-helix domain-containing protein n=1 Tax=Pseudomonas mosselii TaxID=78327 RepID=UPI0021DAD420|nr:helix-turn-helix domain-containing protein [Pseudomonas mosselii]MCU9528769.1 helix-turn-helix domain-containing protein [Pseudomonas mosselii]MCU9536104.1 helix-turn-helix domain-containing protein [Pseudomonas mosselii]MCU9541739.1 helix-turn-helix domain-containing protein [Pseudomonas mosselii]MCU9547698.1 helix-turn-helix domain-containing protein [Pseudomonas mosselii]
MSAISIAVELAGGPIAVAGACMISRQSVDKWIAKGSLPRTEYTGETNYAERISALAEANGKAVDAHRLLREAHPAKQQKSAA